MAELGYSYPMIPARSFRPGSGSAEPVPKSLGVPAKTGDNAQHRLRRQHHQRHLQRALPVADLFIGYGYYFLGNGQSKQYAKIGGYSGPSSHESIRYWFYSNCVLQGIPLSNIEVYSAPTLPGVPPVTSTNSQGQLTLQSGFTVTTNGSTGSVSTNTVPAVKGPGNANDYVQVTAIYEVNTITPLVAAYGSGYSRKGWTVFPVRVSAIVKNEPALLNFEHTNVYSDEPLESPARSA